MRQRYGEVTSYITKDEPEIRELMHPEVHGNRAQSLAEATVPPGTRTHLHRHAKTEELYHVTSGRGRMTLGGRDIRYRGWRHPVHRSWHRALRRGDGGCAAEVALLLLTGVQP